MKWTCEIIDHGNIYKANLSIDGKTVDGLPEYVSYHALKRAIRERTGIKLTDRQDLQFEQRELARYAYCNGEIF